MLLHRAPNTFGLVLYSVADGTQPSTTFGASVTPGNNTYGTYVTLISGASLTYDAYEIEICISFVGVSAAARDGVVSLGIDQAGGTSFTSVADLIAGPAAQVTILEGGTFYKFPYFIKAGSSIGVAAAVNSATATAIRVWCRVKCQPSRPDSLLVGQYIDQFGVSLATSAGTAITEGAAAEGAWTQLGSALTRPCWYWEFGYGCNNATMNASTNDVDIGIGSASAKNIIIANHRVLTSSLEQVSKPSAGVYAVGATGDIVYGRSQALSANTGVSLAAYGVGG